MTFMFASASCMLQIAALQAGSAGVSVTLRVMVWPAILYYAWSLLTHAMMFAQNWDISSRREGLALLITAGVQAVAIVTAAVAESLRWAPAWLYSVYRVPSLGRKLGGSTCVVQLTEAPRNPQPLTWPNCYAGWSSA